MVHSYYQASLVCELIARDHGPEALVALNKGDFEGAKEHFRRVVELDPNSEEGTQASATLAALP